MTLQITLSAESEARLREQAAAGKDVSSFILEAAEEKTADSDSAHDVNSAAKPSNLQRISALHRWAASHKPLPYEADDSRESIYEGRGE